MSETCVVWGENPRIGIARRIRLVFLIGENQPGKPLRPRPVFSVHIILEFGHIPALLNLPAPLTPWRPQAGDPNHHVSFLFCWTAPSCCVELRSPQLREVLRGTPNQEEQGPMVQWGLLAKKRSQSPSPSQVIWLLGAQVSSVKSDNS